jgi:hypothetical protein
MLNFLSRDRVMDDHVRFAESIRTNYNVIDCQVYERDSDFVFQGKQIPVKTIGYTIHKDDKEYIVTMVYVENEAGELSILSKDFRIKTDGEVTHTHLLSLGEVFEALEIKKVIVN